MKVLVTGSEGFIGKNLSYFLTERGHEVLPYDKGNSIAELPGLIERSDFIFHLAGINRPLKEEEFFDGNVNLTRALGEACLNGDKKPPLVFASSTQAVLDNPYGRSKKQAEDYLFSLYKEHHYPVYIYRLYNVFGKWCRPSYNSVIATFCYNVSHGLPIQVNEAAGPIDFVHVDGVCKAFVSLLDGNHKGSPDILYPEPHYAVKLGDIASALRRYRDFPSTLWLEEQKPGFWKDLYGVYLSYCEDFVTPLHPHEDNRGSFTEIFHSSSGQTSVNIGHPGITKGNHYHHHKHEKYVVLKGECLIRLRKLGAKEVKEIKASGNKLEIIDIVPGYVHSITTLGDEDSITLMWANETFDPKDPDTYFEEVL